MLSLTSPVKSPYHKVPPGPKFFLLMVASIMLFLNRKHIFASRQHWRLSWVCIYLWPGWDVFHSGPAHALAAVAFCCGSYFCGMAFTHDIAVRE